MTPYCVETRYILRGVWVRPDSLGLRYDWAENGYLISLTLPATHDDFYYESETEAGYYPAITQPGLVDETGPALSVELVKLEVELEVDTTADEKRQARESHASEGEDSEAWSAFRAKVEPAWQAGHDVAEKAIAKWLSHIRVASKQPWLGIEAESALQYGRSYLIDYSEQRDVVMAFGPLQTVTIRSGQASIEGTTLLEVRDRIASGQVAEIAEALLADALFLGQEAASIDGQRAILSAASACEIKIKKKLRGAAQANSMGRVLIDIALNKTSGLPTLLKQPYEAVFGRPLSQEDSQLYQRMQRLNSLRDLVIHRGEQVDGSEARQLTVAAQRLFEVLDSK